MITWRIFSNSNSSSHFYTGNSTWIQYTRLCFHTNYAILDMANFHNFLVRGMWENYYYKQSCSSFPSRERMERRERALSSMTFLFALFLGGGRNIFPMPIFHMFQSMFFNVANFHHFLKKNVAYNNKIDFLGKNALKFTKFQTIFFLIAKFLP